MAEHDHSWYFTFGPGRWTATCGCGLAVTVEEREAGRQVREWTWHGEAPAADVMLSGVGSVTRARRKLLASMVPGGN